MEQITDPETMQIGTEWPAPAPEQVEVMLLGSYHMNGGLDGDTSDIDDVLVPGRQNELQVLGSTLTEWEPDHIAVERPYKRRETVNELYEKYRSELIQFHEEIDIEPPHPSRTALHTECRSESIQIGFRVAKALDHDRVAPVDYSMHAIKNDYPSLFENAIDEFNKRLEQGVEAEEKVGVPDVNQAYLDEQWARLKRQSIPAHLVERNREPALRAEQYHVFGHGLRITEAGNPIGPLRLMLWYDRNIRMCHHLWQSMDESTDRICFVVGNGHVRILRHLLTEAPMFAPVTALPYLRKAAKRVEDE